MAQLKDLLVNGSARVIGSLFANLSGNVLNFGVCSTATATAAKTVTTNGTFELITGSKILVLFSETDSSNAPTLNVNGTGAKSIKINASNGVPKGFLTSQQYYWFVYDGSAWRIAGGGTTQIASIQYGGTNNNSFTANRPLFFNGTKIIGSTNNYINDTQLGINETSVTSGMNFEVNGKSNFKDLITGTRLVLTSGTDAVAASANAVALIIGSQTGQHLEFDNNEIMSKFDGTTAATLTIQNDGGYTHFGSGGVGINGTNTSYKLYVNGASYFNGLTTVYGPLRVGRDDAAANTGYATANVGANNYIAFYGVYGDNPGSYNYTYIGESIYGPKDTANEKSELLLFHGNDPGAGSGPDRIRLFAGEIDIQVYTSALSGTWDTIRATTGTQIANFKDGMSTFSTSVTVGTSTSGALGIAQTDGAGRGISLYNGPVATGIPEYGIAFAKTATFGTHGAVTSDWATYFTMSDTTTRGWIFRRGSTNVASIDGTGKLYLGYAASAANPGIYWNPYVESASDDSDVSAIYQIKSGVAGGIELRISQANDSNDVINIVSPYYIYLNSKRAFRINDTWLRINEDKGFSSGIYTGTSLVRTDNQLQVGDNGNKFYANSSGNGYFSNTLGIAGTNTSYKLYVNGTSYLNGNATFNGHVLPNTTNTYDLGSSSLRWRKLYVGTANSYGSNNNNQQPIYWNDGVPSPIGWYFKYCTITSSNKSNYPWHRVATCNLGTGSWVDKDCIIVIRARYNGGFYGMIKISARANNATKNPKESVDISATWLIRRGINVDNIRICKKGLSGESNQIDFYVRVGTYARAFGYIVEGSNNGWSLINSNEVNDTTADDKKTSTEVWKDITTSQGATAYDTIVSGVDNTLNGNLAKKLTIQANGTQKGQFNNSADVTVNLGNVVQNFTGANSGNANNINADLLGGYWNKNLLDSLNSTVSGHTTSINSLNSTVSGHTTSISNLQQNYCAYVWYDVGGGDISATGRIIFNTVGTNIGNCYNTSTGYFTVPVNGIYYCAFGYYSNSGDVNQRPTIMANDGLMVMKNGSYGNCITVTSYFTAGTRISAGAYASQFPVNFYAAQGHNYFSVALIKAT